MGKVRYKNPSAAFERNSSKKDDSNLRVSIGIEQSVREYYYLNIDKLVPYEKQARRIFPEEELQQLSETIKQHGVRTPLTVIPSQKNPGKFEVISGERRLRASKLADLKQVPCIIINDDELAEEVALIENIQRSDLHPIELGTALSSLLSKKGWGDVTKLAEKIGKSQSTVSEHLSYSKLPEEIKKVLIDENIRSREILRRLIKSDNLENMNAILGITESKIFGEKNLLRVTIKSGTIQIQDKQLLKLEQSQRESVKLALLSVIKKLEDLDLIDKIKK